MKHKAKLNRGGPPPLVAGDRKTTASAVSGDNVVETVFRQRALAEIAAADTPVLLALASAVSRMLA